MLMRDGPGFGIYFTVFNINKRWFGVSDDDRHYKFHGLSDF